MSPNDLKLRNLLVEILLIDDEQYRDENGPDTIETWDSLAMVRIATEWGLSRRLARGARHTAESLSWDREIERLEQSYREVVARSAPAGSTDRGEAVVNL